MTFKVAARTILQLGSELISSDSVAFYELVKNGFDAGASRVEIDVLIRIPGVAWHDCYAAFSHSEHSSDRDQLSQVQAARELLLQGVDRAAPKAATLIEAIEEASTLSDLRSAFQQANVIIVRDSGSGMSLSTLEEAFLTIGTRYRRVEREKLGVGSSTRAILGDKGVGRLSVMRLGSQMLVKTTQSGERNWHELRIDWEVFSHDTDTLLSEIPISPYEGNEKENYDLSGTELHIWGLSHSWTIGQVEELARSEFARFIDPFGARRSEVIHLTFNSTSISIPRLDTLLFTNAHATLNATFTCEESSTLLDVPTVTGRIEYKTASQKTEFRLGSLDLASIANTTLSVIREIGPFQLELYWWNRRVLRAVEGIGDRKLVRMLLDQWSGGVAIYRDGFRVNPYGGPDDDWLGLDKDAFRAAGYKLNRGQLVAKLSISREANPHLVDQTNREGLQHNAHFLALRMIVKGLLEGQLREFLDESDRQARVARLESIEQLEVRTRRSGQRVRASVRQLRRLAPQEVKQAGLLDDVEQLLREIDQTFRNARLRVQAYEQERERLVALAGTGLLIEIVAHELNRATTNALGMVSDAAQNPNLAPARTILTTLGAQLRTLRTRLTVLDEMSVSGRQVKVSFNLVEWVEGIIEGHRAQFERHQIQFELHTRPSDQTEMRVRMVRGMVVQIMENLLSNSIYWLALQKREHPSFQPTITILIDVEARILTYADNGPGIDQARANDVFRPFVTTKPPGEGSGLGLYIAREVATYHGATLHLSTEPAVHPYKLNAFVLSLANVEE